MPAKTFLKFKKSQLNIDEVLSKKGKYQVQNLIRKKKKEWSETNLKIINLKNLKNHATSI